MCFSPRRKNCRFFLSLQRIFFRLSFPLKICLFSVALTLQRKTLAKNTINTRTRARARTNFHARAKNLETQKRNTRARARVRSQKLALSLLFLFFVFYSYFLHFSFSYLLVNFCSKKDRHFTPLFRWIFSIDVINCL